MMRGHRGRLRQEKSGPGAITFLGGRGALLGRGALIVYLGLNAGAGGMTGWDAFDAVLTPGNLILLISWRTRSEKTAKLPSDARLRRVRIVRDYGMFDRREAPQYYPDVKRMENGA
jgi:hypothetical protein